MESDFYIDEPCVAFFFCGEVGWFLQRTQGYYRYLKLNEYQDRKFILMANIQFHVFVNDFVAYTIDLPQEFYDLGLETDGYEAPYPDSPPGSLTPPDVYAALIEYFRNFYNVEKAIEIWTPRGCETKWINFQPQTFTRYRTDTVIESERPIITVFPRGRSRAPQRNVPEFVWKETVDRLRQDFTVVLCGTPSGASLVDYDADNVINTINYVGDDKMDKTIEYICNSVCTISSQSGPTHISLFCECPSYIIGHERERHTENENRFSTPTSFRTVPDYRAIDADTILNDVTTFIEKLKKAGWSTPVDMYKREIDSVIESDIEEMNELLDIKESE